jgi:hypothetical protein
MSTQFAMVPIIFSAELSGSGASELAWSEKCLPTLPVTSKPALAVAISRFHGPGKIFNLNHLPKKCRCGILAAVFKQICTCRHELTCDSKQYGNGNRLITTVPEWRDTTNPIRTNYMAKNMELSANRQK